MFLAESVFEEIALKTLHFDIDMGNIDKPFM